MGQGNNISEVMLPSGRYTCTVCQKQCTKPNGVGLGGKITFYCVCGGKLTKTTPTIEIATGN